MRKTIDLIQGSPEWHAWRRQRVTASVIPVILGESEFSTPYKLWESYIKEKAETPPSFVMQRGLQWEPVAREEYSFMRGGKDFNPVCFEDDEYPFLGASLDGYNPDDGGLVLEIKVPSREKHEMACKGQVPICYRGQLQTQLLLSGAARADYVSYDYNLRAMAIVPVFPDLEYQKRIITEAQKFMELVKTEVAPSLIETDFVNVSEDRTKFVLFEEWKAKKLTADKAAAELDAAKKAIVKALPHPRVRCGDVRVVCSERKGSIDYAKIPELASVNLEQYRKAPTTVIDIRMSK
jgi:putative phage-type endonuclease